MIRGGYGIYYNFTMNLALFRLGSNPPWAIINTFIANPGAPPITWDNPFPSAVAGTPAASELWLSHERFRRGVFAIALAASLAADQQQRCDRGRLFRQPRTGRGPECECQRCASRPRRDSASAAFSAVWRVDARSVRMRRLSITREP